MIIHVFRIGEHIFLVDVTDRDVFQLDNPGAEEVGIVPYWSTDFRDYVRVH